MNPDFRAEFARRTDAVFANYPDLYDPRDDHPWLVGALGDAGADVWFVGENPSLGQVERVRDPQGGPPTEDAVVGQPGRPSLPGHAGESRLQDWPG
jgi:hypothetical protein